MGDQKLSPSADPSYLALARRAAEELDYRRVVELYQHARAGGFVAGHEREWGLLLIEAGELEQGRQLCGAAPSGAYEPAPQGDDPSAPDVTDDFLAFDAAPREVATAGAQFPAELVEQFRRWFAGRGDVYARQWYDARNERTGYVPVREPLDDRVIVQHLEGRITIGQYLLYPDHHVSFAVIDLDPTAAASEQMRLENSTESGGLALPALAEYAARIARTAASLDVPAFLEDTGGSGLHVWLFFAPRVPARRARAFLRELLWRSGTQPASVVVEIFPKQDQLTGKGLGNLVKLPLGIHQATLRPSRFLDDRLQPVEAREAFARLRTVDPVVFEQLLQQRVVPLRPIEPGPTVPPEETNAPSRPTLGSPRALAEALATIESGKPVKEAVDRILEGCHVLHELARRAWEGEPLSATSLRCLLYSIGLVGRENPVIEQILARTSTSRKELDRIRRGFQSPIGCKRLREYFPDLAARCQCPEVPEAGYATPALFAFSSPPRFSRREPIAPFETEEWVDRTVPDPKADLAAIISRLERMEKILQSLLPQQGQSSTEEKPTDDNEDPPWK